MNNLLPELTYTGLTFKDFNNFQSYIDKYLLPLVKTGDFNTLQSAVIAIDKNGNEIMYDDDTWLCADVFQTIESSRGFHFQKLSSSDAVLLKNQLKSLAIALMYCGKHRTFESSVAIVNDIRELSLMLLSVNVYTLDKLDEDLLIELACNFDKFTDGAFISSINNLILATPHLSFSTLINQRLTAKVLDVELREAEQYLVIPPRIYKDLLTNLTIKMNHASHHMDEIVHGCKTILSCYNEFKSMRYKAFLEGETTFDSLIEGDKSKQRVIEAFRSEEIDIKSIPKPNKEDFVRIMENCQPSLSSQHHFLNQIFTRRNVNFIKVGVNKYNISGKFMEYIRELVSTCRVLILAYTGMRINELYRLSPVNAIQNTKIKNQTIYQITTRQSKIKKGVQTKNDIFVTNEIGYKATILLNNIMQVFREQNPKYINSFNISLKNLTFISPMSKPALASTTNSFLKSSNHEVDLNLTTEDIQHLALSDPGQKKVNESEPFNITNHMFRRSLAYYLIGYELLAFPMLKEQFSHLSSAMTKWYARNASSFQKLYSEIQDERVTQQSKILARVHRKIANNERIAGGKGKALRKLVDTNKNHFEESLNNRALEEEYWAKLIKSNKAHLHAILPGIYCTNSNCDMRISIELAECIECEFDLVEEVFSIEAIRINAMKNIIVLHEKNELSHSSLSHFLMKIKAAEQILSDMNFEYKPFEVPDGILGNNIPVTNL